MTPLFTLSVAARNMLTGKARVLFAVAGVAVAVLLLSFILALYRGWNEGLVTYIEETDADLWIAPFGSDSLFTPGFFSTAFVDLVKQQPGVESITPLIYRPSKLRTASGAWDTWVIGFGAGAPGGPTHIERGSGEPVAGEIVIDEVLAKLSGAEIGDTVDIGGDQLRIVGISSGGNAVFAQLSFVSLAQAKAAMRRAIDESGISSVATIDPETIVNLALVRTPPGERQATYERIRKNVPGVQAWLPSEFASRSSQALRQSMSPILVIILGIAFLVGTLVMGLTVFTTVIEKEREFGVIKALGVPGPGLLRVVFEQAVVTCVLGFIAGIIAAFVAAWLVKLAVPQFIVSFKAADVAMVFGGAIAMSAIASIVPAGRIMRADALAVFKA